MSRLSLSPRSAALVAFAAALSAPAALRAQATTPKVFYACYVPSSGSVYRIKEADLKQECVKTTHVQFSWTDGTSTPGFSQVTVVNGGFIQQSPGSVGGWTTAACPDGTTLIGGSYKIKSRSAGGAPVLLEQGPWSNAPNWWIVSFDNRDGTSGYLEFQARAFCAK